jgi:hypothetical protein
VLVHPSAPSLLQFLGHYTPFHQPCQQHCPTATVLVLCLHGLFLHQCLKMLPFPPLKRQGHAVPMVKGMLGVKAGHHVLDQGTQMGTRGLKVAPLHKTPPQQSMHHSASHPCHAGPLGLFLGDVHQPGTPRPHQGSMQQSGTASHQQLFVPAQRRRARDPYGHARPQPLATHALHNTMNGTCRGGLPFLFQCVVPMHLQPSAPRFGAQNGGVGTAPSHDPFPQPHPGRTTVTPPGPGFGQGGQHHPHFDLPKKSSLVHPGVGIAFPCVQDPFDLSLSPPQQSAGNGVLSLLPHPCSFVLPVLRPVNVRAPSSPSLGQLLLHQTQHGALQKMTHACMMQSHLFMGHSCQSLLIHVRFPPLKTFHAHLLIRALD